MQFSGRPYIPRQRHAEFLPRDVELWVHVLEGVKCLFDIRQDERAHVTSNTPDLTSRLTSSAALGLRLAQKCTCSETKSEMRLGKASTRERLSGACSNPNMPAPIPPSHAPRLRFTQLAASDYTRTNVTASLYTDAK